MPEVEPALRLTPLSVPQGDTISAWGGSVCALRGPGDNGHQSQTVKFGGHCHQVLHISSVLQIHSPAQMNQGPKIGTRRI